MNFDYDDIVSDMIVEVRRIKRSNNIEASFPIVITVEVANVSEAKAVFMHKKFIEKMAVCRLYFPHTLEEYEKMFSEED